MPLIIEKKFVLFFLMTKHHVGAPPGAHGHALARWPGLCPRWPRLSQSEEEEAHGFFFCILSRDVWAKVGIELERNVELYQTL
jgi:hypothetical protein